MCPLDAARGIDELGCAGRDGDDDDQNLSCGYPLDMTVNCAIESELGKDVISRDC